MIEGQALSHVPTRKGSQRKVTLAALIQAHTHLRNEWLANRLAMGHSRSVSRLIRQAGEDPKFKKQCVKLEKMLDQFVGE